jgi:hypothetical protein
MGITGGISMKAVFALAASVALIASMSLPAAAQDQRPTTSGDVLSQPVVPAPESGDIILDFGETTNLYFRHAIQSLKLEDDSIVRAVPRTNHVVAFTALYPGKSFVSIQGADGKESRFGVVTVTHHLHEVKVYVPPKQQTRINAQIVIQNGETQESKQATGAAGYYSVLCNEIGCRDIPK